MKLILTVFLFTSSSLAAKILGIFPAPISSHRNLYAPLMQELARKGHNVTVVTPFKDELDNVVHLSGITEWMWEKLKALKPYETVDSSVIENIQLSVKMMTELTEKTLAHENMQKLIRSGETFDVVIAPVILNHAHYALAPYFGAPLILFSTVGSNIWTNSLVGNPNPTSYVPDLFTDFCGEMTFWERLKNSLIFLYAQLYYYYELYPNQNELIKKYISHDLGIDQVLSNVSLILLNSHPSLNQPVPRVPNMIDIGGFHIKPPGKLPRDLQEYLNRSPNGIIYFSMGSNLRSAHLPKEKRDAFLKTFAKLKENVIWKWEDDVLPGKPPNVKLGKWLPQQEILSHPNIKLFITHGGLLSTTESVYHGVPVLAIPIYGDQKLNAKIAVRHGFGLSLSFEDVNEDTLMNAITEILNDDKFRKNAKKRSEYFNDRLTSPMETAIYWVEYVIRHKGAQHLRVAGLDLPWYQYLLLDVVIVIIIIVFVVIIVAYIVVKTICKRFCLDKKIKKS